MATCPSTERTTPSVAARGPATPRTPSWASDTGQGTSTASGSLGVASEPRVTTLVCEGDVHVPLRVVEDIDGGSVIELHLVAPTGLQGTVVVDLGTVEH